MKIELEFSDDSKKELLEKLADAFNTLAINDEVLRIEDEVKGLASLSGLDVKISEMKRTLSSLTLSLLQNQMGYNASAPQDVIIDADVVCHSDVHGEDYAEKSEITENIGTIVIADGVTEGCDGSEVAARVACETFIKFLEKNIPHNEQ